MLSFTNQELGTLNEGLLTLIEKEDKAFSFTGSETAREEIKAHRDYLLKLLNKITNSID